VEALTERSEREARFLAREIPPNAQIVALLFAAEDGDRAAAAADAIATSLGRRREHTLLASCESSRSSLDEAIGGVRGGGLHSVLEGRARLSDVAVRRSDRPFVYLPAGRDAPSAREMLATEAFRGFVGRVRARGGTLLLHLPLEEMAGPVVDLMDGCLTLGEIAPPGAQAIDIPCWGKVAFDDAAAAPATPDAETAAAGEAAGEGESPTAEETSQVGDLSSTAGGGWRRHRARTGVPWSRVAIGALGVGGLVAAWWFVVPTLLSRGAPSAPRTEASVPAGVSSFETEAPGSGAGLSDEAALAIADRAPELGYSVLIASYAARSDAEQRLADAAPGPDELFFLAPTPVRGAVYYRVFAGALGGRSVGRAVMDLLVASGRKDAASAWDVRPSRLAFRLGVFGSRDAAETALRRALADSIPAYLLRAADGAGTAYQLYAGAYESERAARALAALLERRAWEAELVVRRGESRLAESRG